MNPDAADPWRFQRWAFQTKVGNPIRKAVLSMLAMMADHTTGRCEVKQETLAQGVETTKATIATHLKALVDAGLIARRPQFRFDRGRRGDEYLLLAPGITEWPDGAPLDTPPRVRETEGGTPVSDTPPSVRETAPQEHPLGNDHASKPNEGARDARDYPPDGFPEELKPHARAVVRMLRGVAADHGAKKVWPKAVCLAIMANPHKPVVATAHEMVGWAVDPPRKIVDVVATYRTFLKKAPTLEAIERIDEGDGSTPAVPADPTTRPGGPAGRPLSAAERLAERTARRQRELDEIDRQEAGGAA